MPHKVAAPGSKAPPEARAWPTLKELCQGVEPTAVQESNCICRFASTNAVPLKLAFRDSFYNLHLAEISNAREIFSVVFPVRGFVQWEGDEKDEMKVANVEFVQATFKYEESSALNSHGISVHVKGYGMTTKETRKLVDWSKFLPTAVPAASVPQPDTRGGLKAKEDLEKLKKELQATISAKETLTRSLEDVMKASTLVVKEKEKVQLELQAIEGKIQLATKDKENAQKQLQDAQQPGKTPARSDAAKPAGLSVEAQSPVQSNGYHALNDPQEQQTCCQRSCAIS